MPDITQLLRSGAVVESSRLIPDLLLLYLYHYFPKYKFWKVIARILVIFKRKKSLN